MIKRWFRKVVDVRDEELNALLWATAYGFLILFSYYILRAVRDDISSADRGNLQLLWTAVSFVMLGAVPLYSWVSSRLQRTVIVHGRDRERGHALVEEIRESGAGGGR